jgi:hypothetical protein
MTIATEGGGTPESFTEAEAASLAQKPEARSATLPDKEKALLSIVLSRVEATEVPSTRGFQRQVEILSQDHIRPWLTNIAAQRRTGCPSSRTASLASFWQPGPEKLAKNQSDTRAPDGRASQEIGSGTGKMLVSVQAPVQETPRRACPRSGAAVQPRHDRDDVAAGA